AAPGVDFVEHVRAAQPGCWRDIDAVRVPAGTEARHIEIAEESVVSDLVLDGAGDLPPGRAHVALEEHRDVDALDREAGLLRHSAQRDAVVFRHAPELAEVRAGRIEGPERERAVDEDDAGAEGRDDVPLEQSLGEVAESIYDTVVVGTELHLELARFARV